MKSLLSTFLLLAALSLFANAGVFRGSGQTIVLDSTTQIQMVEEVITMTPMRGNYPIDTSCRNLDPMKFHCFFKLRNLTDQTVTVPVGFPISMEAFHYQDNTKINQTETIAAFGFIAGTKEQTYPIRYVPFDKKKKFSNIFLWDMTFQPKQELELYVCYTMQGYLGMSSTIKERLKWKADYKHNYLHILDNAVGQGHQYVTETGKSWAGKIEKATFRIAPFNFEEYLTKRGSFEEKKNPRKQLLLDLLAQGPMVRNWTPEYKQWKLIKDKRNRNLYLELVYAPFTPKDKADNLTFMYLFPAIPTTPELFERLLVEIKNDMNNKYAKRDEMLKLWKKRKEKKSHPIDFINKAIKHWQKQEPYSPSVARNLADVILEFYGIQRNNPEIKDFLEKQCWYPAEPQTISPALKKHLLELPK